VQQARERHVTTGRKMRIDTTVVEAPIHYPTDSALCEDSVRVLRRAMCRLVAAGVKLSIRLRHVGRSVSRRMREIGRALRLRGEAAKEAQEAVPTSAPDHGAYRSSGRGGDRAGRRADPRAFGLWK